MHLNETHDPALRSWVESAQAGGTDFPIQNLPHGVFRRRGTQEPWRGGVAIGECILDMAQAARLDVWAPDAREAALAAGEPTLDALMALGPPHWHRLRAELSRLLRAGAPQAARLREALVPLFAAEHALPARVGDYTDFLTSWHHMVNAGAVLQPGAPPLPHFKWLPIAYHGRSSTVEVSGAAVYRPSGQARAPDAQAPQFGPSRRLDYELEIAVWIGPGNVRGRPIAVEAAEPHVFGLGLLNDWSARDLQGWESMPLGPFLSKNFLTTVSPWIVTLEALEPFRCALPREPGDAPELPYLRSPRADAGFDLQIEAWLHTPRSGAPGTRLSRSSFRHSHWSVAQMVAHHTVGGCCLRTGDLLGTGTQSGPGPGEQGCLLELSHGGTRPIVLPDDERRAFLEDGDTIVLKAWGERDGAARIGFGDCRGTVRPAAG
jgi:fumarylacetoacetase